MQSMYAIVRFTDEERTLIVPCDDIKHFDASKTVNFKKKYLIKFLDDGYYPGQIVAVKDIYRYFLTKKCPDKDVEKEVRCIGTYIRNKISDLARTLNRRENRTAGSDGEMHGTYLEVRNSQEDKEGVGEQSDDTEKEEKL